MTFKKILFSLLLVISHAAWAVDEHTDIKFYGQIRTHLDHDKIQGTPDGRNQPDMRVTNFISKFGLRVKEPLDGGWVVNARMETYWFLDDPRSGPATRIGDELSTIGFSNNYVDNAARFTFDMGRAPNQGWLMLRNYGIYNDTITTPLGEIHQRNGLRWSNGVFLTAKPFADYPLYVAYDHQFRERELADSKDAYGVHWRTPSYSISAVYITDNLSVNSTNSYQLGAWYQAAENVRVSGLISVDERAGANTTGYSGHVRYLISPRFTLIPGLGYRSDASGNSVKTYNFGADYELSKRVTLQFRSLYATSDEVINFTAANDLTGQLGTSRTQITAGVQYLF
jgi:predicted porin